MRNLYVILNESSDIVNCQRLCEVVFAVPEDLGLFSLCKMRPVCLLAAYVSFNSFNQMTTWVVEVRMIKYCLL